MNDWMQTYSAGQFFFDETAGESQISILDIARSLSRINRFLGHSTAPISVAEHSVVVMEIVATEGGDTKEQLYGLLHDAHEAYLGDMSRPLKRYLTEHHLFNISALERQVQARIYKALGIPMPTTADMALVERADLYALAAERRLYLPSAHDWHTDAVPLPEYVMGSYGVWGDDEAMRYFEKRETNAG